MPDDFTKSQIYKVVSANHDQVYYGSTTKTLEDRFDQHKSDTSNCSSRLIIATGQAQIHRVEWFPCSGRHALEDREAEFILTNRFMCVNQAVPGAVRRAGGKKAYRQTRGQTPEFKANESARKLVPVLCTCGIWSTKQNIKAHQRTKKCKRRIESQVATVVLATPF